MPDVQRVLTDVGTPAEALARGGAPRQTAQPTPPPVPPAGSTARRGGVSPVVWVLGGCGCLVFILLLAGLLTAILLRASP